MPRGRSARRGGRVPAADDDSRAVRGDRALARPNKPRGFPMRTPRSLPPGKSHQLPVLLTPNEVAASLRTSRKAVYAMIERGQLPGIVRIARRVLVREDALLDWLRQKSTPS